MKIRNQFLQLLQQYGLKPPTLSDEVASYGMLLVMVIVIGGFFLVQPSYKKFQDSSQRVRTLNRTIASNERSIKDRFELQDANIKLRNNLAEKQLTYVTTQVDHEIMSNFIDIMYRNNIETTSMSVKPVNDSSKSISKQTTTVVLEEGSPFVVFQLQAEVSGTLNDLIYFIDDLHKNDSYTLNNVVLRLVNEYSNPYGCDFHGSFTVMVYTVKSVDQG